MKRPAKTPPKERVADVGEVDGHELSKVLASSDPVAMRVADRLRRARQLKGLTLAQVASSVGLSHNFLSMVERGVTDLSLSRFRRLAAFYGMSAAELLGEESGTPEPQIAAGSDGLLIDRGAGITYRLLPNQEFGVQVMHVRFAPRAGFAEPLSHEGADIAWVVRGKLTLVYGEEEYALQAGQCVSYKAMVPHAFMNRSNAEAELFAVVTIPYW